VPALEAVSLKSNQVLAVPGEPIRHIYFPRTAVVSLLVPMEDGSAIEGAVVGNEGLIGLDVFLGDGTSTEDMVVQIPGPGARLPVPVFRQAMGRDTSLNLVLHAYLT
jgi:hypothetical protein